MLSPRKSLALLVSTTLLIILVLYLLGPIPQRQSYHHFADQRSWQAIPNAWNVLSNIAILLPGVFGLGLLLLTQRVQFNHPRERLLWVGVSFGLILTAVGSTYYHLNPDDSRLVSDRMSMIVIFMSLAAALISERIHVYLGLWLWPILLGIGFYSVLLWYASEQTANSDLRLYLGSQLFAILVAIVMLLSSSPYDRNVDLAVVIACYGLAVLCDSFDRQIYQITQGLISGHTMKHLAVGVAGMWLIKMIWKRKRKTT